MPEASSSPVHQEHDQHRASSTHASTSAAPINELSSPTTAAPTPAAPTPSTSTPAADQDYWPIEAIVGENKSKYKVKWVGLDPATGRPWALSWVKKNEVTHAARAEWLDRKAKNRNQKKRLHRQGRHRRTVNETGSEDNSLVQEQDDSFDAAPSATQASEFQPTQFLAPSSSPLVRTRRRGRRDSFHLSQSSSSSSSSDSDESDNSTQLQNAFKINPPLIRRLTHFEVQIPIRRHREPTPPSVAPSPSPVTPFVRPHPQTPAAQVFTNTRVIPDSQGFEASIICDSSGPNSQLLGYPGSISPVRFVLRDIGVGTSPPPQTQTQKQSSFTVFASQESQGKVSHAAGNRYSGSQEESLSQSSVLRIVFRSSSPPRSPPPSYEESQRQSQSQSTEAKDEQRRALEAIFTQSQEQFVPESPQVVETLVENSQQELQGGESQIGQEEERNRDTPEVVFQVPESQPVRGVVKTQAQIQQEGKGHQEDVEQVPESQPVLGGELSQENSEIDQQEGEPDQLESPKQLDQEDHALQLSQRLQAVLDTQLTDTESPAFHLYYDHRPHDSAQTHDFPHSGYQSSPNSNSEPESQENPALLGAISFDYESFPQPPGDFSPYSSSFPPPPEISSFMSGTPSSSGSTPRLSLKEKLALRQKALDERIAVISTPTRQLSATPSTGSRQGTPARQVDPSPKPVPQPSSLPPTQSSLSSNFIPPPPSLPSSALHTPPPPPLKKAEVPVPKAATPEVTREAPPPPPPPPSQTFAPTQISSYTQHWGPVPPEPQEFYIGLPLNTSNAYEGALDQKTIHYNAIISKHEAIESFLAKPDDPTAAKEIFGLTYELARIATHPDLAFPPSKPAGDVSEKRIAELDVIMSSKFKFLKELMSVVKHEKIKIGIVAEEGALLDMLEVFFRGIRVAVKRLDRISKLPPIPHDEIEGAVLVLLVPSSRSGAVGSSCCVVIAMDSTFDPSQDEIIHIRQNISFTNQMAPVLHLVALNTIEHIIPCSKEENLAAAVEAVKILRNDAGVIDKQYGDALGDGPKRVGTWIAGGCQGDPPLPPLPDLPLYELATQTQTQTLEQTQQVEAQQLPPSAAVHQTTTAPPPPPPELLEGENNFHYTDKSITAPIEPHQNQGLPEELRRRQELREALKVDKRKREEAIHLARTTMEEEMNKSKKRKFTPASPTTSTPVAEASVSENTPAPEVHSRADESIPFSAARESSELPAQAEFPLLPFPSTIDASQSMDLDTSPSAASSPIQSREGSIEPPVPARPIASAPDPDDLESLSPAELISRLRLVYEELDEWKLASHKQSLLLDKLRVENNTLITAAASHEEDLQSVTAQRDRALADLKRCREEKAVNETELEELRADMRSSANPTISRLATLSTTVSGLRGDLDTAKSRLASTEKDGQFAMEQYQAASNANYSTRREMEEMQSEMEELRRKADMRPVELQKVLNERERKRLEEDNDAMKVMVKELQRGWERERLKVGELEERIRMGRGSLGLRGVAAGTRSGSVPRAVRGSPVGSRSGSPAAGKGNGKR